MTQSNMSRRRFLKAAGLAALSAALANSLAACQPAVPAVEQEQAGQAAETAATAPSGGAKKKLVVYWGDWTPTESMARSEDNPLPHNKIVEVLEAYKQQNPNVEVEWLRLPQAQTDQRQWTIAQQTGGTVPHIVPAPHWVIKEDLDKNWWVDLTPFLNQPNPYIAAGEPGSQRWLEQFYPIPTSDTLLRGKHYNIVLGLVTTFFYYNVDMFKQVGVEVPKSYAEFLKVCQAFKDAGIIAYGGWTGPADDTDHWYRLQLGGMLMARDIEPQVNPDRDVATREEVSCAIKNGIYHPRLLQYQEWMELWKQNVPYRPADWTVPSSPANDSHTLFFKKQVAIMENGTWSLPRLLTDPQIDFEWSAFFAPPLTKESSEYVTAPPTPGWPIGGPVTDTFGITTRAEKDGVLDEAVDLLRWLTVPKNLETVQGEIGTAVPNVKGVKVDDRFKEPFEILTGAIGEQQMFVYEQVKMDLEAAQATGQAWWSYLLDQISLEDATAQIDQAFTGYVDRFTKQEGFTCG